MNLIINVGTCATAAFLMGLPIGARGGAILGGIWTVTNLSSKELLGENRPVASIALSTVAAWKIAELCGIKIALLSVAWIGCVLVVTTPILLCAPTVATIAIGFFLALKA